MGILHSIIRFLCCSTTQREDDEESQIRPLVSYPAHEDSSTFYTKGLLQKLPQPRKAAAAADPILPIRNPAPITFANSTSEIRANTCSHVGVFKTQDRPQQLRYCEEVYDVSSRQWPPKTSSKIMIQNVVPAVKESKKIVEKGKETKREEKDEAIIVKRSTVVEAVVVKERWIKHYSSRHRILVVGDGDFSFSASLAVAFRTASNMTATSLNSIEFLKDNYSDAASNIGKLRSRGCEVIHGIDATEMANNKLLNNRKFDRIIFNFPFAGFFKDRSPEYQLSRHRGLVSMFMKNAREMINEINGEIHISHKSNDFHIEWNLESLASSHRLRLIEAVKFYHRDYPGYHTKCGFGDDYNFNCNPSKTYKFGLESTVRY